jgi:hypothetical protein
MNIAMPTVDTWAINAAKLQVIGSTAPYAGVKMRKIASFVEDFSSALTNQWTILGSPGRANVFTISGGQLQYNDTANVTGGITALATSALQSATTWTMEFDMTPLVSNLLYIYFNFCVASNASTTTFNTNCYQLNITGLGTISLAKKGTGAATLGSVSHTWTNGVTYRIKIERTASNLNIYVDNVLKLTTTDTTYLQLGYFGFISSTGYSAQVRLSADNFSVIGGAAYATDGPVAELPWIGDTITKINGIKLVENFIEGGGTPKYQFAYNNGLYSGTWLTRTQLEAAVYNLTISNQINSFRVKIQFNSNGSQQCEVDVMYIICDIPTNTVIVEVPQGGGLVSIDYLDNPAFLYRSYDSTMSIYASDTYPGFKANDCRWATEDTVWKGANQEAGKSLTVRHGSAVTANSMAMVGEGFAGVNISIHASTDNFVTSNVEVLSSYIIPANNKICAWKAFDTQTYPDWRITFNSAVSSDFCVAHIVFGMRNGMPYFEQFDPDNTKPLGKIKKSPQGKIIGAIYKGVQRSVELIFGSVNDAEYQVLLNWSRECFSKMRPFFFIPAQNQDVALFAVSKDSSEFSAPIKSSGDRQMKKIVLEARAD